MTGWVQQHQQVRAGAREVRWAWIKERHRQTGGGAHCCANSAGSKSNPGAAGNGGRVPTAAIEQHGRHLPIETDCRIVEEISRRAAERVSDQIDALVTPAIAFGVSGYHMEFAGTLTLSMGTFITVVEEICESLIHHGFRRIIVLNGHGGNHDPIKIAARNVADKTERPWRPGRTGTWRQMTSPPSRTGRWTRSRGMPVASRRP